VILADPPWRFSDRGTRMAPSYEGPARGYRHYRTMSADELCGRTAAFVQELAAPVSLLFLWAPHALVLDGTATRVARAWGFEPKQEIVWVKTSANGKPRIGGGHYARICTEPLVLCARPGAAQIVRRHDIPNVIFAPRGAHSAKPDASYGLIEELAPGPYLEIFARRRYSDAWTAWGDQLQAA
jgi:N6-adenosine-specific RNA methylase IME4